MDTLTMLFLHNVVCLAMTLIIPIIPLFFSIWFEITNVFKRLQDLDKSKAWKIGFVVLYIMVRVSIVFFIISESFNIKSRVDMFANFYVVLILIYLLFYLYLLVATGTQGANRYGRSPEELKKVSK